MGTHLAKSRAFTDKTKWEAYTVTPVAPGPSYFGGTFDGHYVYFAGDHPLRYDTNASFADPNSWKTIDLSNPTVVTPTAPGTIIGAVFDGRYVYLVPQFGFSPAAESGLVFRHDTINPSAFSAAAGWTSFDMSTANSAARGYQGAAFDGRYVYLIPGQAAGPGMNTAFAAAPFARFDTKGAFDASGWSFFSPQLPLGLGPNYFGATFDGRYLYFAPASGSASTDGGAIQMPFLRYDTNAPFDAKPSWATFVHSLSDGGLAGFEDFAGSVFDGRYVYFVPAGADAFVRFDAKSPPSLPPGFTGSFY
jgi:hypothetical protein